MSKFNRKGPEEQGSMTGRKMGKCTGKQFDEDQLAKGMGMRRKSHGNKGRMAGGRNGRFGNGIYNGRKGMGQKCQEGRGNGLRRNADVENL